jgi:acylglycerol lipase
MQPVQFSWETKDKLTLVGQEWKPEGKAKAVIVLVHGLGEHCNRYQHLAEFYNKENIGVVSFDLRGHGKSEGLRGHAPSYDAICIDIKHCLDHAQEQYPKSPVFLYGHSLGGALVLYFLLKKKPNIKGAIVTAPVLSPATAVPPMKFALAKLMNQIAPKFSLRNDLDRSGLSRDPQVEIAYSGDPLVHGMISARLGMELITNGQMLLERGSEFDLPMLLLQGSADRIVSCQKTIEFSQKTPKTTTFKLWEGHYHELHNEPDKLDVLTYELEWIKRQL